MHIAENKVSALMVFIPNNPRNFVQAIPVRMYEGVPGG